METENSHARIIQRCARRFLSHKRDGTLVFRHGVGRQLFAAPGKRGMPYWLEAVNNDTRRTLVESLLASQLEEYTIAFTTKQVAQPQKAEVMHRLLGSAFMAKHHPEVPPNPTALGPPYLDAPEVSSLVAELRGDLLAYVAACASRGSLYDSAEWREAEMTATVVAMAHYRDEVAHNPSDRRPSPGVQKRQVQREQLRLELEGLTAGLDAVLTLLPGEAAGVLEMLRGRRVTPRLRQLMWRKKLVTPAHVAAVARKLDRMRGDPGGSAPIPSLLGQMVQTSLATSLQLYATTQARLRHLVDAFGALFLLRESFDPAGLRTCLVVTMGLASQTHAAQAAIADAILSAQVQVQFGGVQERVLKRTTQLDPMLGSRLAEAAWRVVIEPWVLKWCSVFMVGLLQPEPLLFLWDQCILIGDWRTPIEACCVAVLLGIRDHLLTTRAASEAADVLSFVPRELTLAQFKSEFAALGYANK